MLDKSQLSTMTELDITGGGYEDCDYKIPVLSVEEYLSIKDPYYSEFIVLPDGKILEAKPSHTIVLESLVNYLNGGKFTFSVTWFIEEVFYYTGAVSCWEHGQMGFSQLTEKQKTTLETLANHQCIRLNYECYSEEKIDYFLSLLDEINLQKTMNKIRKG